MYRKTLFLICAFCLSFVVNAQDFDYEVSKPYQVIDARTKHYLSNGEEIMAIKAHGKRFVIIQKWNANSMNEISRVEYEDLPKGFQLESFQKFQDNYYMFYSVWDKPNEKEQLFARRIDFETGKFTGQGELVLKVNGKVTRANASGFYGAVGVGFGVTDKFNIQSSFDESKVLVQYRKKPKKRNDDISKDVIGLAVFNSSLEEIAFEEVKMPYTESKMNNLDYSVDSKGNVYILTTVYKDDTQRLTNKNGEVNYHVELLRIDTDLSGVEQYKVDLGQDVYLNELTLFSQKNDQMVCAGFYAGKKSSVEDADGVVLFKVDDKGEVSDVRKYEIPLAVLNMYKKAREQKKTKKKDEKGKAEFNSLVMRNLVNFEDGSSLVIGEQYYVVRHTYTDAQGRTRTTYTYYYNDILATKIGADGEMEWMKKLGKRQSGSSGQGGMSFEYFSNNDSHYFLFLDNIKNLELGLNERPAGHSDGAGGFFMAYKIDDSTGNVYKEALFDTRDVHGIDVFQFRINRIVQISDSEFVVEVYKKKKEDILIKVRVKV